MLGEYTRTSLVLKDHLLKKIKENRANHRAEFLAAQTVYRQRVIEELDKRLDDARNGRTISLVFSLPTPQDYTESYDTAIAMLEWEQGDKVEISEDDFRRYVENKWEWARAFAANTSIYTTS
jgi:hypothetical protein